MSHKKGLFAFVPVTLVGVFSVGCGGSACDDLETQFNDCCAKAPEGTSCSLKVEEGADEDTCQAFLDDFKCEF